MLNNRCKADLLNQILGLHRLRRHQQDQDFSPLDCFCDFLAPKRCFSDSRFIHPDRHTSRAEFISQLHNSVLVVAGVADEYVGWHGVTLNLILIDWNEFDEFGEAVLHNMNLSYWLRSLFCMGEHYKVTLAIYIIATNGDRGEVTLIEKEPPVIQP